MDKEFGKSRDLNKENYKSRDFNKKYTYLFSIHFKVCGSLVAILGMVVKKFTTLSLNSLVNECLAFTSSAILCKFYLIIVYDLKAKCTINNFRMFLFSSNHSLLYIPMHCKTKKRFAI